MFCETCDKLLYAYRLSVSLFRNSVVKTPGPLEDDSRLSGREMDGLSRKCKDASDALMTHLHQDHGKHI